MESVSRIRCPNSGHVALFPDDRYELNTPISLKYSSRSWQNASCKSQLKKHSFQKNTFCPNFKVFSFDFSEEIMSVLKQSNSVNKTPNAGGRQCWSQKSLFLKTVFYFQFWFYSEKIV